MSQESIPGQPDASMFPAGADNIQKGDGHEHFMLVGPNKFHYFFCGAATQRGLWPPHSCGF